MNVDSINLDVLCLNGKFCLLMLFVQSKNRFALVSVNGNEENDLSSKCAAIHDPSIHLWANKY